jgi:methylmalonyl-CoA/ethylmalonyl-CoA epimerase
MTPTDSNSTGIKLERAVQIGIVVPDLERATTMLTALFGIGPFRFVEWPDRPDATFSFRGKEEAIRIRQAFVQVGNLELELIQPIEGERNAYRQFLDEKGGGIHHLLFEVPDIEPVLEEMKQGGVQVLQAGTGIRPGTRWALLDTEKLIGFLLELRHRPDGSDGSSIS